MGRQHKAFLFLDFLFSTLPVLFMLLTALNVSMHLLSDFENQVQEKIVMDKLISISDYVVRYAIVEKNGEYYLPNKISEAELGKLDTEKLREKIGLEYLYVGFEQGTGNCIYRLVLHNDEIKKIYFCGE